MVKRQFSRTAVEFPIRNDQKPNKQRPTQRNHSCSARTDTHARTKPHYQTKNLHSSMEMTNFADMLEYILYIIVIVIGIYLHDKNRHMKF